MVTWDLPISPRFTPTSFRRDAGSALLHLANQSLNFPYSRPHTFRYGNQNKTVFLLSLELTNSDYWAYVVPTRPRGQHNVPTSAVSVEMGVFFQGTVLLCIDFRSTVLEF